MAKTLQLKKWQQALFDEHRAWAEAIGRRLCSAHLPPCFETADLVQAALIGLAKACREFDRERGVPFAGFAHVYVQGECFMSVRRRNFESTKYEELSPSAPAPESKRPDVQARAEIEAQKIQAALAKLPFKEREAIRRTFFESMQLAQLARSLQIRQLEAELLLAKAQDRMRELLS